MAFRERLVRGSLIILIASIGAFLLSLARSIIIAQLLKSADLLGLLGILGSVSGIFGTIASFGIPTAVTRYTAQTAAGDAKARPLVHTSIALAVFLSALSGAAMFVSSWAIAVGVYRRAELVPLLQVGAVYVALSSLVSVAVAGIRGLHRMGLLASVTLAQGLVAAAASLALVSWFGLVGAAYALMTSAALACILAFAGFSRAALGFEFRPLGRPNLALAGEIIRFSAPVLGSGLVLYPALWLVETFLALRVSIADLGLYGIGYGFYNLLVTVPSVLAIPLMPLVAEMQQREPGRVTDMISKILRIMIVSVLPIGIGIAFSSRFLLTLLYGDEYAGADVVASLLVLAALFVSLTPVISSLLLGSGRATAVLGIDALWAAIFVPSAVALISQSGLLGIGYAHLVARAILLFVMLAYLRGSYSLQIRPLLSPLFLLFTVTGLGIGLVVAVPQETLVLLAIPAALLLSGASLILLTPEERRLLSKSAREAFSRGFGRR